MVTMLMSWPVAPYRPMSQMAARPTTVMVSSTGPTRRNSTSSSPTITK